MTQVLGDFADPNAIGPGEGEQIPYEELVANAITQQGILTIHQVEDQWYLEDSAGHAGTFLLLV